MTKAAELAKMGEVITNSQIGGRRNIIINGSASVNQRGDSTGVTADGYYGPDRWAYKTEGEETVSISQASDGPDGFANSYKVEVTTADSTIAADDYARVETRLEGQNLQHLKYGASGAESITLSFYVKSSVTGTYALGFYSADGSRNIGSTYTISSANTWEYKTLTFAGDTSGTINDDNGEALRIWFLLSAGSNFTSSDNTSWAGYSDSRVAYGHTTNVIGTSSATWQITGVQLEVGEQATPFEHRSFGEELALCQRYYQKITGSDSIYVATTTEGISRINGMWTTTMRSTPTSTIDSGWNVANLNNMYQAYNSSGTSTFPNITADSELQEIQMTIISAKYCRNNKDTTNITIEAVVDGETLFIPLDPDNKHYQAILEWVAEGNTIAEADQV